MTAGKSNLQKLNVRLGGVECGNVTQTSQGDLKFEYLDSYSETQTPLSLSMPVSRLTYPKNRILPYLQGLLPDNSNALKALASKFSANANNAFSLLQHVGHEVAGAVEFFSEDFNAHSVVGARNVLDEWQVEAMLVEKVNEYEDGTAGATGGGNLSLAGAHPKLALQRNSQGLWLEPKGNEVSTHIIKPVPERWKNLHLVEHQTMLAARILGLNVAKTEISVLGNTPVFITERYDRTISESGVPVRVHQEDMCQALSISPAKKYQKEDGGPGVGEIAKLIREFRSPDDQNNVAVEFFKALAFNVIANCTDAHAKNYSLLLQGQSVRLAPLYDLSCTLLYSLPMKSAMSINGKYSFSQITDEDLIFEASRLRVDPDISRETLKGIRNGMVEAFDQSGSLIRNQAHLPEVIRTTFDLVDALRSNLRK